MINGFERWCACSRVMAYLNVEKVANILARSVPLLAKVDVGARVVLSADPAPLMGRGEVVDVRYFSMNNKF